MSHLGLNMARDRLSEATLVGEQTFTFLPLKPTAQITLARSANRHRQNQGKSSFRTGNVTYTKPPRKADE